MKKIFFKNIQNIAPYKFDISDSFDLYFRRNKNNKDNCKIEVNGTDYYNGEEPKAKSDCCRYYLELEINNLQIGKTLVVLMLNPSNTFPEMNGRKSTVDGTVKNVVRIAYKVGYSKVIILNSFNFIDGNSQTAIKSAKEHSNDVNIQIIQNVLSEHKELLFAWGASVHQKDKTKILSIIWDIATELKMYAYAWNKNSNCPYHPATRVDNRKNNYPVTNFLIGDGKLMSLAIRKNLSKGKYELVLHCNN